VREPNNAHSPPMMPNVNGPPSARAVIVYSQAPRKRVAGCG